MTCLRTPNGRFRRHRTPAAPRPRRKLRRRILIALLIILSLPVLLAAFVKSGLISPLIEGEAVAALSGALPESLSLDIGDADVIVEGLQGVGVSLGQFVMKDKVTGKDVLEVDRTRIGVTTLSALRGKPQLQNIEVSGIRLNLANARSGSDELPAIAAVETGLGRLLDYSDMLIESSSVNGSAIDIKIGDMTVTGHGSDIFVKNAVVIASPGQRAIEAEIEIDGRTSELSGMVRRSLGGALIARFRLDDIALPFARVRTLFSDNPEDHLPGAIHEPVRANVVFTARRTRGDSPDQLTVNVEPTDFAFKLDDGDLVPVTGRFNLAWTPETKVFSLRESRIRYGRSSAVLTGGVRDAHGVDGTARQRAYQFELIANNGVSNPIDSPERAVQFAARAIGTWTPSDGVADVSHIELESEAGSMEGAGTFDFFVRHADGDLRDLRREFRIGRRQAVLACAGRAGRAPMGAFQSRWRPGYRRRVPDRGATAPAHSGYRRDFAGGHGVVVAGRGCPLRRYRRHSAGSRCDRPDRRQGWRNGDHA